MNKLTVYQISNKLGTIDKLPSWLKILGDWPKQLQLLRAALGMTQKQLAKRINCPQLSISKFEKNKGNPTLKTLKKIASALNCELFIALIPKEELQLFLDKTVENKVRQLLEQSVSNSAMELQKPTEEAIRLTAEELRQDLWQHRDILWN